MRHRGAIALIVATAVAGSIIVVGKWGFTAWWDSRTPPPSHSVASTAQISELPRLRSDNGLFHAAELSTSGPTSLQSTVLSLQVLRSAGKHGALPDPAGLREATSADAAMLGGDPCTLSLIHI